MQNSFSVEQLRFALLTIAECFVSATENCSVKLWCYALLVMYRFKMQSFFAGGLETCISQWQKQANFYFILTSKGSESLCNLLIVWTEVKQKWKISTHNVYNIHPLNNLGIESFLSDDM